MGDNELQRAFDAGFQAGYAAGLRDRRQSAGSPPQAMPTRPEVAAPAGLVPPARPVPPPLTPAQLAQHRQRVANRNLNSLLYLSSLLLIGAAAALLAGPSSSSVKLAGVWGLVGLFFGSGLVLVRTIARLRPAGMAFVWTGLAIIPFGGVALAVFTAMPNRLAWMLTSLVALAALAAALIVIRRPELGYLSVLTVVSLVVSGTAVLPVSNAWMLVALVVTGLGATLARRMLPRRHITALLHRPSEITTWAVTPVAIVISWGSVSAAEQVAVALAGGIQYAVAWVMESSWPRFVAVRVLLLITLLEAYAAFPTGRYGALATAITGSALAAFSAWLLTWPRLTPSRAGRDRLLGPDKVSRAAASKTSSSTASPADTNRPAAGHPPAAAATRQPTPNPDQATSEPQQTHETQPPAVQQPVPTVGYPVTATAPQSPGAPATVRTSYGMVPAVPAGAPRSARTGSPAARGPVDPRAVERLLEQTLIGVGLATIASAWLWRSIHVSSWFDFSSWFSVLIAVLLTLTAAGCSLLLRNLPLAMVAGAASFLIPVTSPFAAWGVYDATSNTMLGALVTILAIRTPPRRRGWVLLAATVGCGHLLLGSVAGYGYAPARQVFLSLVAVVGMAAIAKAARLRALRVTIVVPAAIALDLLLSESGVPSAWRWVAVPLVALVGLVTWMLLDFRRPQGLGLTLALAGGASVAAPWLAVQLLSSISGPDIAGEVGLLASIAVVAFLWLKAHRRVYLGTLVSLGAWTVLVCMVQNNAYLALPPLILLTGIAWFVALPATDPVPTGLGAGIGAGLQVLAAIVCWTAWPINDVAVAVGYIHAAAGILAAATLWWRRHTIPMLPAVLAMPTVLVGLVALNGNYVTLFLAEQIAIVVLGTWLERRWAIWWGLITSTLTILIFVRGDRFFQLILLAVTMIAVVVWRLLRQSHRPERPTPPLPTPSAANRPAPPSSPGPPDPGPQPAAPDGPGPRPPDQPPAAGSSKSHPHRPDHMTHGPRSQSARAEAMSQRSHPPDADRH